MASAKSSTKGEYHVAGKYRLVRKIGSGSFGDIYLAMNIANGEVGVLLKRLNSPLKSLDTFSIQLFCV